MEVVPDGVWGGMPSSNQQDEADHHFPCSTFTSFLLIHPDFVWGAPLSICEALELCFSGVRLSCPALSQNLCAPLSPLWTILMLLKISGPLMILKPKGGGGGCSPFSARRGPGLASGDGFRSLHWFLNPLWYLGKLSQSAYAPLLGFSQ